MTNVVRLSARVLVALVGITLAAWFIYGFGAGYFGVIGLPTPLNVVATVVLSWLVVRWAWRYVRAAAR